jgi:hypothetical protein
MESGRIIPPGTFEEILPPQDDGKMKREKKLRPGKIARPSLSCLTSY